jgi:hypothetical protein
MNLICLIKTIWRTLCSQWFWASLGEELWGGNTLWVSGHDYICGRDDCQRTDHCYDCFYYGEAPKRCKTCGTVSNAN